MDPIIPTSFIPKRPIVTEAVAQTSHSPYGIVSLITSVLFLGTLIAAGGVFVYERQLQNQKNQMEQRIVQAKEGLALDFINQTKQLGNRIAAIKSLIQSHIVVTPIFNALQSTTLRSVQYKSFTYSFGTDDATKQKVVKVEMSGTAKNYETIALQSDAFANNTLIRDAVFSNLSVEEKKGLINFNLRFNVSVDQLSYQAFIDSLAAPASQEVGVQTTL